MGKVKLRETKTKGSSFGRNSVHPTMTCFFYPNFMDFSHVVEAPNIMGLYTCMSMHVRTCKHRIYFLFCVFLEPAQSTRPTSYSFSSSPRP